MAGILGEGSFILFSKKGPKGLLKVATKYNMMLPPYLSSMCIQCIHSYLHIHIIHIYTRIATQVLRTLFKV